MKMRSYLVFLFVIVNLAIAANGQIAGPTSIFTYQGRLTDGTAAASATYQMQFSLYDASGLGNLLGSTITNTSVTVANGIFTVQLDFGTSPFSAGADRWLEIAVRKAADPPGFTTLTPRQQITSSPYSIRTLFAGSADSLSASCILCVTDSQISGLAGSKVTGTVANATTAGNLSGVVAIANGGTGSATGNGSGLNNLNGSNIATGTVDDVRLSSNVVLKDAAQSLTNKTIDSTTNTVTTDKLRTATGVVDVKSSAAPIAGQVLTATGAAAAIWKYPASSLNSTFYRSGNGTATNTFVVPAGVASVSVEAWGGGGGQGGNGGGAANTCGGAGGGSGAPGLYYKTTLNVTPGTYTVLIGSGGPAGRNGGRDSGQGGDNGQGGGASTISDSSAEVIFTASGGGGGGGGSYTCGPGGTAGAAPATTGDGIQLAKSGNSGLSAAQNNSIFGRPGDIVFAPVNFNGLTQGSLFITTYQFARGGGYDSTFVFPPCCDPPATGFPDNGREGLITISY